MLGMRTIFFAPSRISELVVSCFVSSILPNAKRRLNFSTSVVGAVTTTTGAFCSSFFLPNAIGFPLHRDNEKLILRVIHLSDLQLPVCLFLGERRAVPELQVIILEELVDWVYHRSPLGVLFNCFDQVCEALDFFLCVVRGL